LVLFAQVRLWKGAQEAGDIYGCAAKEVNYGSDLLGWWDFDGRGGYVTDMSKENVASPLRGISWAVQPSDAPPVPAIARMLAYGKRGIAAQRRAVEGIHRPFNEQHLSKTLFHGVWSRSICKRLKGMWKRNDIRAIQITFSQLPPHGEAGVVRAHLDWADDGGATVSLCGTQSVDGSLMMVVQDAGTSADLLLAEDTKIGWMRHARFFGRSVGEGHAATTEGRGHFKGIWKCRLSVPKDPCLPRYLKVGLDTHDDRVRISGCQQTVSNVSRNDAWSTVGLQFVGAPHACGEGSEGLHPFQIRCREASDFPTLRWETPVSKGKVYYEIELSSSGVMQLGWASPCFKPAESEQNGVGDYGYSFAVDGSRKKKWYKGDHPYGGNWSWKEGDVVGCSIDFDAATMSFSVNGADLGVAFSQTDTPEWKWSNGMLPAGSFGRRQGAVMNLGQWDLKFMPDGFVSVLAGCPNTTHMAWKGDGGDRADRSSKNLACMRPLCSVYSHADEHFHQALRMNRIMSVDTAHDPARAKLALLHSGKYLWEIRIDCLGKVGRPGSVAIGVCAAGETGKAITYSGRLGGCQRSWSWVSTGHKCHGGSSKQPYGPALKEGDIIGVELDLDSKDGVLSFYRNGVEIGEAYTNIHDSHHASDGLLPCVALLGRSTTVTVLGLKNGVHKVESSRGTFTGMYADGKQHGPSITQPRDKLNALLTKTTWKSGKKHGVEIGIKTERRPAEEASGNGVNMLASVYRTLKFDAPSFSTVNSRVWFEDGAKVREASPEEGELVEKAVAKLLEEPSFESPGRKSMYDSVWKTLLFCEPAGGADAEESPKSNTEESAAASSQPATAAGVEEGNIECEVQGEWEINSELPFVMSPQVDKSIRLSPDLTSAALNGGSGSRYVTLGSQGFNSGIHYWEVKIESCRQGSMFIGVALKDGNFFRWGEFGFVSYRATIDCEGEKIYGQFFNTGDRIGVLLNMENGTISYIKGGQNMILGRPEVVNMGVAHTHVKSTTSSLSFKKQNSEQPMLYPAFGFSEADDKVTVSKCKWFSVPGIPTSNRFNDLLETCSLLQHWSACLPPLEAQPRLPDTGIDKAGDGNEDGLDDLPPPPSLSRSWTSLSPRAAANAKDNAHRIPIAFVKEAWEVWKIWRARWVSYTTRCGVKVLVNTDDEICKKIAGKTNITCGKRLQTKRGWATVLGTHRGYVWYTVDGEDCGAWYWDADEIEALEKSPEDGNWECPACTFGNDGEAVICCMCETPREMDSVEEVADNSSQKDLESKTLWADSNWADVDKQAKAHADKKEGMPFKMPSFDQDEVVCGISWEVFQNYVCHPDWWPLEADCELVKYVNSRCNREGIEPDKLEYAHVSHPDQDLNFMSKHSIPPDAVAARFAVLLALNRRVLELLPFADLAPRRQTQLHDSLPSLDANLFDDDNDGSANSGSGIPGLPGMQEAMYKDLDDALAMYSASELSLPASYIGRLVAGLRELIFLRSKMNYWSEVLHASATGTTPPSDEYDKPETIQDITLNRIQANPAALAKMPWGDAVRSSLLGQLYREMQRWPDMDFRRSYVDVQDAGQQRAFFVKFLGEGVDDHGGPYRAALQTATCEESAGFLKLLVPFDGNDHTNTGAEESGMSNGTAKMVFNSGKDGLRPDSRLVGLKHGDPTPLQLTNFWGKLCGVAIRHGTLLSLNLPSLLWRPLAGLKVGLKDISTSALEQINILRIMGDTVQDMDPEDFHEQVHRLLGDKAESLVRIMPDGEVEPFSFQAENINDVLRLAEQHQHQFCAREFHSFRQGLAAILPVELLTLFAEKEVELLFCGPSQIDVDLLQQVVVYDNVTPDEDHITFFWEALNEMNQEERAEFVNFVSARSRLPACANDFTIPFKIGTLIGPDGSNPDGMLPKSQTCFFSLSLPKYTSKETCKKKLLYAITNSPNMDADFVQRENDAWK
jgi:hypothetical protein